MLEKSLHTLGAQRLKSVHTVLKMLTPVQGGPLISSRVSCKHGPLPSLKYLVNDWNQYQMGIEPT